MKYLWYGFAGVCAGIFGGMGMGGGTVLIPLASLLFPTNPLALRTANLVSFVPMAITAVCIHTKNGLIEKKGLGKLIFAVTGAAFFAAVFSLGIDGSVVKRGFGIFLILLSAVRIFRFFLKKGEKKEQKGSRSDE